MSKKPAARIGDIDTGHPPCPPTPIITGNYTVMIEGKPAACQGDLLAPHHPGARVITSGAPHVMIGGKPAARVGDSINCGGVIAIGASRVVIGDDPPPAQPALPPKAQRPWPFGDQNKPAFFQALEKERAQPAAPEPSSQAPSNPQHVTPTQTPHATSPGPSPSSASETLTHNSLPPRHIPLADEPPQKHWVQLTVLDDTGQPLADTVCRVTTPDGASHLLNTDKNGQVRVEDVTQNGRCQIRFPAKTFLKNATQLPNDGNSGSSTHTIAAGESLLRIARTHGLASAEALYHHPSNATFRKARPDPNLTCAGDQLSIPKTDLSYFEADLNTEHVFVAPAAHEHFRLNLNNAIPAEMGLDLNGKRAVITVGSQVVEQILGQDGQFDVPLTQHTETEAQIELYLSDDPTEAPEVITCQLAQLEPIDTLQGIQARLNLMGYPCGPVDGIMGQKTREGISAFQHAQGLRVEGVPDPMTKNTIVALYGC